MEECEERIGDIMEKILAEKISYTEVNKNISQSQYMKIQEEYLLSQSREKYMISMPVRVLMFQGIEEKPAYRYYFYEENNQDLFLIQNQTEGSVVNKTKFSITREDANRILSGDYKFLLESDEPGLNSLYFQFTVNQLKPTYKKTCTRKVFHQNRFLDIIIDIDICRTPFEGNDFFKPVTKLHSINTSKLRCHTRQYFNLSKPIASLLEFNQELLSQQSY